MIIHLTGNASNIKEDISYFRTIIKTINQNDGVVARDWVETAQANTADADESTDWQATVEADMDAIRRADVVIIEGTHNSYMQGYQTAVALEHKKPVLVVSRNPVEKFAYSGIKHRMLSVKGYKTEEELAEIVEQFIKDNTVTTKDLRFNMFIDRPIHNYLRSVSHETGKNKSEIIRDLINHEIQKKG
jgi:hypothetical protein